MKHKILSVIFVIIVMLSFQGCKSEKAQTTYSPLKITDAGLIQKGDEYVEYSLQDFLDLLNQKNIPVKEIKGSDNVRVSDAGSVLFEESSWEHSLYQQDKTSLDKEKLFDSIKKNDIQAVYIKTQYETFVFAMASNQEGADVSANNLYSDIIISTNPNFETEKGVKIGDSFDKAAEKYGFKHKDIVKISDKDWSVWVADSNIVFKGNNNEITTIKLGHKAMCSQ